MFFSFLNYYSYFLHTFNPKFILYFPQYNLKTYFFDQNAV